MSFLATQMAEIMGNSTGAFPISGHLVELDLTGYAVPFYKGKPLMFLSRGTTELFAAIFSTVEKLESTCADYKLKYDDIQFIEDPARFIEVVLPTIRIGVDPHRQENGLMRFLEVQK